MKSDMWVELELMKDEEMKVILGGMDFKTKIKMIKKILFKNEVKIFFTSETVHDLKRLLERGYRD